MLISKQYNLSIQETINEINYTGLSPFVLSLHELIDIYKPETLVIFRDEGYPQATHICEKLDLPIPTIKQWMGVK